MQIIPVTMPAVSVTSSVVTLLAVSALIRLVTSAPDSGGVSPPNEPVGAGVGVVVVPGHT